MEGRGKWAESFGPLPGVVEKKNNPRKNKKKKDRPSRADGLEDSARGASKSASDSVDEVMNDLKD